MTSTPNPIPAVRTPPPVVTLADMEAAQARAAARHAARLQADPLAAQIAARCQPGAGAGHFCNYSYEPGSGLYVTFPDGLTVYLETPGRDPLLAMARHGGAHGAFDCVPDERGRYPWRTLPVQGAGE